MYSIIEMFCQEPKSTMELGTSLRERAKENKKNEKEKVILLLNKIVDYISH